MQAISIPLSPGNGDCELFSQGISARAPMWDMQEGGRPVSNYRITDLEAQFNTKQKTKILIRSFHLSCWNYCLRQKKNSVLCRNSNFFVLILKSGSIWVNLHIWSVKNFSLNRNLPKKPVNNSWSASKSRRHPNWQPSWKKGK